MKPIVRFPLAIGLLVAAIAFFALAEHEVVRTNFFIIPLYGLSLAFLIAGLLAMFNKLHKIVPDDWSPYSYPNDKDLR
ncbi:MAG: hypothetical protein JOZ38_02620 [Candidatus Eremiobacteraeota bacterium]|nr:hypothetical protein [Candidatus Eremiobacteraeota bacterium]